MDLFLRLLLSYLLVDFYLCDKVTSINSSHGRRRIWLQNAVVGGIYGVLSYLLSGLWSEWGIPIILFATYMVLQGLRSLIRSHPKGIYVTTLIIHIAILVGMSGILLYDNVLPNWAKFINHFSANTWLLLIAYLLMLRPASILMAFILKRWNLNNSSNRSLPEAGKWIGYLERILILTFIIADCLDGVGFLLAAKSIFRFGDLNKAQDIQTTEYVMIGTMTSFTIAIVIGLLLT